MLSAKPKDKADNTSKFNCRFLANEETNGKHNVLLLTSYLAVWVSKKLTNVWYKLRYSQRWCTKPVYIVYSNTVFVSKILTRSCRFLFILGSQRYS